MRRFPLKRCSLRTLVLGVLGFGNAAFGSGLLVILFIVVNLDLSVNKLQKLAEMKKKLTMNHTTARR